jgi:hypothetical protein
MLKVEMSGVINLKLRIMHATENLIICEENLSTNKHP